MALSLSVLAIINAALDGNLGVLKQMASQTDLREAKDNVGRNALHFAAMKGHLEVCSFLVEELGIDVNCTNTDGVTPVKYAAATGEVGVLRYLLDHGGDPEMPDARDTTPLHFAAEQGHCEALRLLLSKGVDVDALHCRRLSPLLFAVGKGHDQAVNVLLEHGADPNIVAHNRFSPLIMACIGGSLKCMRLLVEAGADVNLKNHYGTTALIIAVQGGFADIVRFLLEAGADPNISDANGKIAIMYAANKRLRDLVQILFPHTKPITSLPNWSIDGIIDTMTSTSFKSMDKEHIIAGAKPRGNEAFAKGDYLAATLCYDMALLEDPLDATLFSNRSLCWLRLGDGKLALLDAQQCKAMRPRWPKAWYREGAALSLLKDYKGAVNAFLDALMLDPANDEIKTALREATEALSAACSEEQNP
ncbi:hypothetical protein SORBI_3008G155800 [Sorghum bicolor]|uniref:Uncharacterized protein n=1 Tax=Sorghum bicolor TaxID=4558 RepID=A0A1Z5R6X5_SORBI|nr:hypothetical protein SORBI_3008G155800 [Sorghum bicolor]